MQIKLLNLVSTACIFAFVSAAPVVNSDGLDASALNDIEVVGLNDIHLTRRQNLPFGAVGGFSGSGSGGGFPGFDFLGSGGGSFPFKR